MYGNLPLAAAQSPRSFEGMTARIAIAARALLALALLASWTTAGWAAACALREPSPAGMEMAMGMHHAMHGAIHHHTAPHRPDRPRGGGAPDCPLLAMNGGGCIGAAHLPAIIPITTPFLATADGYPPADGVRDQLLTEPHFHPPRA
jgi:hypothetical protein